jgi:hypothetical protein
MMIALVAPFMKDFMAEREIWRSSYFYKVNEWGFMAVKTPTTNHSTYAAQTKARCGTIKVDAVVHCTYLLGCSYMYKGQVL